MCEGAAAILNNGSENAWLHEDLSSKDAARMQEAFLDLVEELSRRGGRKVLSGAPRTH